MTARQAAARRGRVPLCARRGAVLRRVVRGEREAEPLCLVMIETRTALDRTSSEIAATPGLDGIYIGPSDLALTFGLAAHPTVSSTRRCSRRSSGSDPTAPSAA